MERLLKWLTGPRARSLAVLAMLLGAAVVFTTLVQKSYAIEEWLFWHYAAYWVACLVWLAGVVGVGQLTLVRGFGLKLSLHEGTVVAFALGLFEFELVMQAVGLVHGFRTPTFFVVPLAFLGVASARSGHSCRSGARCFAGSGRRSAWSACLRSASGCSSSR